MRLLKLTLAGYRRFQDPTSIVVEDRLVAIVGRNEAGKSSVLAALRAIATDEPLSAKDRTRDSDAEPELTALFHLEAEDEAVVDDVRGGADIGWVKVVKRSDGYRHMYLDAEPTRDLSRRRSAHAALEALRGDPALDEAYSPPETPWVPDRYNTVLAFLASDIDRPDAGALNEIDELVAALGALAYPSAPDPDEEGEVDQAEVARRARRAELRETAVSSLRSAVSADRQRHPSDVAEERLRARLPGILQFTEADRSLLSGYDLTDPEYGAGFPSALTNLARLAELELASLRDFIVSGDQAAAQTAINRANGVLAPKLEAAWGQSDIVCQLQFDGTVLRVYVHGEGGDTVFEISDRSEGLRSFIALQAFVGGRGEPRPIVLIDEAETHLHYDAQVDLVDVLFRQRFAAQVVYTTHSIGCLPPDLVSSIRAVVPAEGRERSSIEQSVWAQGRGLALTPLLMGMGAKLLALVVPRYAVLTEGASDSILIPQLLRAAATDDALRFRFAPGLSDASCETIKAIDAEAGRVALLVDGDVGGSNLTERLIECGADSARIVSLGDLPHNPATVEDFVSPGLLAAAVNLCLHRWREIPDDFEESALPVTGKWAAVAAWCEGHGKPPPGKPQLAQATIDLYMAGGFENLFAAEFEDDLRELFTKLSAILDVAPGATASEPV